MKGTLKLTPNRCKEYVCELTEELNLMTSIPNHNEYGHYIYVDEYGLNEKCFEIRIQPGCVIGGIKFDEDMIITEIAINDDNIIPYPDCTNDLLQKYIGMRLTNK